MTRPSDPQGTDLDADFRSEIRASLRDIRESVKIVEKSCANFDTALTLRGGGVLDRLSNVEDSAAAAKKAATETREDLNTIKAKVAFAAACVSALVAAIWAVATKIWDKN
jgi:hypothetical protein